MSSITHRSYDIDIGTCCSICGRHDVAVLASVTAATVAVLSHNTNVASTNKTDHHHHHRRRRRRWYSSSIRPKRRVLSRLERPEVGVVVVVYKMMFNKI